MARAADLHKFRDQDTVFAPSIRRRRRWTGDGLSASDAGVNTAPAWLDSFAAAHDDIDAEDARAEAGAIVISSFRLTTRMRKLTNTTGD